jgi:hypothetical protein
MKDGAIAVSVSAMATDRGGVIFHPVLNESEALAGVMYRNGEEHHVTPGVARL